MSIAELSIKRPVSTIMLFVSLVVIGLIAAFRLPLEAFPEVSPPFIFVQMPYAGSTPEDVERTVLRPVEETLSTMAGSEASEDCVLAATTCAGRMALAKAMGEVRANTATSR